MSGYWHSMSSLFFLLLWSLVEADQPGLVCIQAAFLGWREGRETLVGQLFTATHVSFVNNPRGRGCTARNHMYGREHKGA